ncbi:hypothetical protein EI555_009761 [Monodon monoceros]|uniref:Ig-like domain-containing protein n=1 Tax=Monodon monoceros TaxID=40151 RepID=A0A4U1EU15_MONMO|nr:hypothetical protein EI555_009761 [Monodon monoceros]
MRGLETTLLFCYGGPSPVPEQSRRQSSLVPGDANGPWAGGSQDSAAVGFVSEDEYLEIQGITREQSGDYECSASNDVAAPVVRRVKVTVNYPPYISEAKGTGVPVGQTGTLQCEASAVPSAEFQWYKDDKRLVEGKKGVKVENRPFLSKLIFLNVSEHDYGNYTCVASNKLGHTNASITLFEVKTTALTPGKGCIAGKDNENASYRLAAMLKNN